MQNMSTDNNETHYSILGVSEQASNDEIKQAYRKLSFKLHPDKNNNDPEKLERYKKINAAYSILSNPKDKNTYDTSLHIGDITGNLDPNIFMNMMFNPIDIQMVLKDLQELKTNNKFCMPKDSFNSFGFRHPFSFNTTTNDEYVSKLTVSATMSITLLDAYKGCKQPLSITRWITEGTKQIEQSETIYVDIPPGIDNNEIITIKDKGNKLNGHIKGDVEVKINIDNNTLFERNGIDLIIKKSITLKESLCGFIFDLTYIDNREFRINNEPGNIIPPNFHKIIPNLGMTRDSSTGDLIIIFDVIYPKKLSVTQIEELSKII